MKLLKLKNLPRKSWKNGQGTTTEIAIEPPEADFLEEKFLWRLSCAEINASNQFSQFIGYNRILMVWKGDGVFLNGNTLLPFVPYHFEGSEKVECRLVRSPVQDLGIIFKKDRIKCEMEVLISKKGERAQMTLDKLSRSLILILAGTFKLEDQEFGAEEIIDFGPDSCESLICLDEGMYVLLQISKIQRT